MAQIEIKGLDEFELLLLACQFVDAVRQDAERVVQDAKLGAEQREILT